MNERVPKTCPDCGSSIESASFGVTRYRCGQAIDYTGLRAAGTSDVPCLLVQAENRIAELEAQVPKWISVEDELPKNEDCVLCFDDDSVFPGFYSRVDAEYMKPGWCDHDGNEVDSDVVLWCELPRPSTPEQEVGTP